MLSLAWRGDPAANPEHLSLHHCGQILPPFHRRSIRSTRTPCASVAQGLRVCFVRGVAHAAKQWLAERYGEARV
jgi:hypothetical protein